MRMLFLLTMVALVGCTPPQCVRKYAVVHSDLVQRARFIRVYSAHKDWWVRCIEARVAADAVTRGLTFKLVYQSAGLVIAKAKTPAQILAAIRQMHSGLSDHAGFYGDVWESAINERSKWIARRRWENIDFDFTRALEIVGTEITVIGVFEPLESAMAALTAKVKTLPKDKYAGVKAAMTVLSQYNTLAHSPRGSLLQYRQILETLDLAMRRAYRRAALRDGLNKSAPTQRAKPKDEPVRLP